MNIHTDFNSYKERNLQGFEGDSYLKEEFEKLIVENNIDTIIETGTYLGGTTKQFASMVKEVHTIELNVNYYKQAQELLIKYPNVRQYFGSSTDLLPKILKNINGKLLIFLDAHWFDYCPLLDELKIIAESGIKPIIAIHDFKVPGKDFGYDSYKGIDFDYNFIKTGLNSIYGELFTYYYNSKAEGAKRGCIFVLPK